jgi:glycosyltransferase involved in cell wall biosynthesis
MKILFLAPYAPFPPRGGGEQRMYHMLRLTAERHDVHLLTFVADDNVARALEPLRSLCGVHTVQAPVHSLPRRVRTLVGSGTPDMVLRGQDERFAHALAQLLNGCRFDVVQAESIEMAQYGRFQRRRVGDEPLWVYDAFNAEYLIQRRAFFTDIGRMRKLPIAVYSFVQWMKLWNYERSLARRFDLAFAVSHPDRRYLSKLAPRLPVMVVPNGVDTMYFQRHVPASGEEPPVVLFTGTLDFRPNIDALAWFVGNVWRVVRSRRPNLRFCVVGQRPTPEVQQLGGVPGVEIIGPVDDVRPWFNRAAGYVLPMRVGGGVRLKLLETWSMGLPCVTTTLGTEGVDGFVAGEHALVADDAAAFANAIERLLDEPALRSAIAQRGRHLVEDRYDWRPIVAHMEQMWQRHRGS